MIKSFKENVRLYARMFQFARPYISLFILTLVLSFVIVGFEALTVWVPASLIKTLFVPQNVVHEVVTKPEFSLSNLNAFFKYYESQLLNFNNVNTTLKIVCLLMAVAYILKNVTTYGQSLLSNILNLWIIRDMRNTIYNHALRLPVSYYDRNKSGSMISRLLNDVNAVNRSITNTFSKLLIEPIRLITFTILLLVINYKMTLVVFLIYPFLGVVIVQIGKAVRRRSKRSLENLSGLVSILHETMAGLRVVKMFNMNQIETDKFKSENKKFIRASFRSQIMNQLSSPLTETLGMGVAVMLLWYGGREVLSVNNSFSAEDFIRFLFILIQSYRPLKALSGVNNSIQGGFAAAERIFDIIDSPPEKLSSPANAAIPSFTNGLSFNNVSFHYPGHEEQVLDHINFSIPKGKIVALVGSSGSGKTTILDLIPRFYDVSEGMITIDDRDIQTCDLVGYRSLFGIVAQDTVLFNDSVYNNISYGVNNASDDDVMRVAQTANALEFIEKLPQGMNTVVGERGVMLSGGQRQRIAIARALLKNPPILILDEATSALDTESERAVQSAINALMKNRTAVVVAHRLSTVQHADQILVLDNGKVVEMGTHDELIQLGKRYRYFYDIQFGKAQSQSNSKER